jgi:hypothetical protein
MGKFPLFVVVPMAHREWTWEAEQSTAHALLSNVHSLPADPRKKCTGLQSAKTANLMHRAETVLDE